MPDKVKALKIESSSTGGTQNDPFPVETNPTQDYLAAKGIAFENNDNRLIDLDASGNIQFKDATQTGYFPFWKMIKGLYTDFDNTLGKGFTSTNVQSAINELRDHTILIPDFTATTLNGTLTLTSTSKSAQVLTGSATGFSVVHPDARTLVKGWCYNTYNNTAQTIAMKDGAGATMFILAQRSIGYCFLIDNSTLAGTWACWQITTTDIASGIINYINAATTLFTTTSPTDVAITGFSIIPQSGTYAAWVSGDWNDSNSSAIMNVSVYYNGSQVADSKRIYQSYGSSKDGPMNTQTKVQCDGLKAIDVRVNTTAGTLSVTNRSFILIRMGP